MITPVNVFISLTAPGLVFSFTDIIVSSVLEASPNDCTYPNGKGIVLLGVIVNGLKVISYSTIYVGVGNHSFVSV